MALDRLGNTTSLIDNYLSDHLRTCQHASNALVKIAHDAPKTLVEYIPIIFEHIKNPPHDAAIRNGLRIFQFLQLPEYLCGEIYEYCYTQLTDIKNPVGIRAFAATIMYNISKTYPELQSELFLIFEQYKDSGTVALSGRIRKHLIEMDQAEKQTN